MIVRLSPLLTLAPVLWLASCSRSEPSRRALSEVAPPGASSAAQAEAVSKVDVTAALGGSVFFVGGHPVELAIFADGRVDGLVYDERGQEVAPERVTELTATLVVMGAANPRVALGWEPAAKRFRGHADPRGELVTEPIDVALQIDGKALTGELETYALLPPAQASAPPPAKTLNARARLGDAKALADAKPKAPKASATSAGGARARAEAKLALPKPKASVSGKGSAGAEKKKAGAGVKAKASFGIGN